MKKKINKKIRPGVKALIVHDSKVLVISENVQRDKKKTVIHDFPGGGIEFGESLEEALKREVKEEIGLNIELIRVVGAWDFILDFHHDKDISKVQIVCIGFQCKIVGDLTFDLTKNPAQEDIFKYEWFTKDELLDEKKSPLNRSGMINAVKSLDI